MQDEELRDDEGEEDDDDLGFLRVYNHEFRNLDEIEALNAAELLEHDRELVKLMRAAADPRAAFVEYVGEQADVEAKSEDDLYEFFCEESEPLALYMLLDPGIASSVAALHEIGATPYASCNGGALKDEHHFEKIPLVAFLAEEDVLGRIWQAAGAVGAQVDQTEPGHMVSADKIETMVAFAERLLKE